jgi:myo-inositol catabolism protein IolS
MEYRRLGRSGLNVSVLTLGAWQLGDPEYWGAVERSEAEATVLAAIDAGVNLFDTAEWYGAGRSEQVLGEVLGSRRGEVLIASKVSPQNCTREGVRRSCEASLRRLGTDVIDLYQVHWPNREVPFAETCAAMLELRDEGKIRAIGVSNFGRQDLEAWLAAGPCDSDQIGYNAVFRAPEYEILPACRANEVGVLAYMPLMQGILTGRWNSVEDIPVKRRRTRHFASTREGTMHTEAGAEGLLFRTLERLEALAARFNRPLAHLAIAWLIAQPGVTSVIAGAGKPEQVRRNVEAAAWTLDADVVAEIDGITEPLKAELGRNPDMWKCGDEARIR